jgi:hypothetical protein
LNTLDQDNGRHALRSRPPRTVSSARKLFVAPAEASDSLIEPIVSSVTLLLKCPGYRLLDSNKVSNARTTEDCPVEQLRGTGCIQSPSSPYNARPHCQALQIYGSGCNPSGLLQPHRAHFGRIRRRGWVPHRRPRHQHCLHTTWTGRAIKTSLEHVAEVVQFGVAAVKSRGCQTGVCESTAEFNERRVHDALAPTFKVFNCRTGVMAERTALFTHEPEREVSILTNAGNWVSRDDWKIEALSVLSAEYYAECVCTATRALLKVLQPGFIPIEDPL